MGNDARSSSTHVHVVVVVVLLLRLFEVSPGDLLDRDRYRRTFKLGRESLGMRERNDEAGIPRGFDTPLGVSLVRYY